MPRHILINFKKYFLKNQINKKKLKFFLKNTNPEIGFVLEPRVRSTNPVAGFSIEPSCWVLDRTQLLGSRSNPVAGFAIEPSCWVRDRTQLLGSRSNPVSRFNATKMLESMRGKRLVFVGDSVNRNQWESMLCMLMGAVRDPKKVYETHGRRITKEKGNYSFKFVDYKCTVEYYVSHFLVHEGKARVGQKRVQTLRIDSIDRGLSRWRGADILIFNTAHWWTHYKTKAGINYYQEGDQVHPRLDVSTAFRRALMTWASWVDKHIKPSKTQVFFRNSAPSHFRFPFLLPKAVIKQMKTHVILLNITSLSEYRIEGHPSRYGRKPDKQFSSSGEDCSHWCLPGVPDTWNELLYFHLQSKQV
ncbi:hypothetical protein ACOSQ4_000538 [Xanthoceras sorbifolium]